MGDDEAEMNVRVRIVVVALTRGWMVESCRVIRELYL